MDVIVTSPLGDALPVEVKGMTDEDAIDLVEFRPDAPGKYKFAIRYGGEQIPESPVTFAVQDDEEEEMSSGVGQEDVRHELRVFGQGLQRAQFGAVASFEMEYVHALAHRPDFPDVDIFRPDGSSLQSSVGRAGGAGGGMLVTYTPDSVGLHVIKLRFPNGHTMDYPTAVTDIRAIKLARGFDPGRQTTSC